MTENLKQPMETAPYGAAKAAFGGKREADGGSKQAFAFGDSEGLEAVKMRSTELSELARSVLCSVEVAVEAAHKAAARISEAWDGVQQVSSSLVAPEPQLMQPPYTAGDDQTPKAIAEAAYALRNMANAITHAVTHWKRMTVTSPPGSTTSPGVRVHPEAMRCSPHDALPAVEAPPANQRLLLVARGVALVRCAGGETTLQAGEFIRLAAGDEASLATDSRAEVIQITGRLEGELTVETIDLQQARPHELPVAPVIRSATSAEPRSLQRRKT